MIFKRICIFFLFLLFAGCKKDPAVWEIKNLNENKISAFGHGGMGIHYKYPINSYESLSACLATGADGTEMDVCVTTDSVLVLSHSQNLEDQTKCNGLIKNKSWAEIAGCNYNSPLFSKADLIQASYFFDRISGNKKNLVYTFDCKVKIDDSAEYIRLFAEALLRHIEKYELEANCFIESYNADFLRLLASRNKALHLFLYTENYQTGLEISGTMDLYGLTLDQEHISAAEISDAHKHNLRITLFNAHNERENLAAIAKSPDFIQSDRVEHLVNALSE